MGQSQGENVTPKQEEDKENIEDGGNKIDKQLKDNGNSNGIGNNDDDEEGEDNEEEENEEETGNVGDVNASQDLSQADNDEDNENEIVDDDKITEDGDMDEDENDEEEEQEEELIIGGKIDRPAYALLAGMCEETKGEPPIRVSIPVTTLPAVFGRTHKTDDSHFFGLGNSKALSRNHAVIYYRDLFGGQLVCNKIKSEDASDGDGDGDDERADDNGKSKLVYLPPPSKIKSEESVPQNYSQNIASKNVIRPLLDNEKKTDDIEGNKKKIIESPLPVTGFFAIECLGKNKIQVGRQRVDHGQVAQLLHGTTIKVASYSFYFLLPEKSETKLTLPIPNLNYEKYKRKRGSGTTVNSTAQESDSESAISGAAPAQKRSKHENMLSPISTTSKREGKTRGDDYDKQPVKDLLKEFHHAIDTDTFERKHQLLSSAIMLHAARDAARDKNLRKKFRENGGGVSRVDIMDWVAKSPLYSKWVTRILGKLEVKSYQANMSKSLIKVGYTRLGTTGRHVKWVFPKDILNEFGESKEKDTGGAGSDCDGGSSGDDNDDDDDDDGSDNDEGDNDNENDDKDNNENQDDRKDEEEEDTDNANENDELDENQSGDEVVDEDEDETSGINGEGEDEDEDEVSENDEINDDEVEEDTDGVS